MADDIKPSDTSSDIWSYWAGHKQRRDCVHTAQRCFLTSTPLAWSLKVKVKMNFMQTQVYGHITWVNPDQESQTARGRKLKQSSLLEHSDTMALWVTQIHETLGKAASLLLGCCQLFWQSHRVDKNDQYNQRPRSQIYPATWYTDQTFANTHQEVTLEHVGDYSKSVGLWDGRTCPASQLFCSQQWPGASELPSLLLHFSIWKMGIDGAHGCWDVWKRSQMKIPSTVAGGE